MRPRLRGAVHDLSLTIDGVAVADLQQFRVHSQVFRITAADGNVFGVPAGTTRSVADGTGR